MSPVVVTRIFTFHFGMAIVLTNINTDGLFTLAFCQSSLMLHDISYFSTRTEFNDFMEGLAEGDCLRCHKMDKPDDFSNLRHFGCAVFVLDFASQGIEPQKICSKMKQTFPELPVVAFCHEENLSQAKKLFPDFLDDVLSCGFDKKLFIYRLNQSVISGRLETLFELAGSMCKQLRRNPVNSSNKLWPFVNRETDTGKLPTMEQTERRYIQFVLDSVEGNRTVAARILGFDRKTLWRKLKGADPEAR